MNIDRLRSSDYEEVLLLWKVTNIYNSSSDSRDQIDTMIGRNPETCIVMKSKGKIIGVLLGGYDGRRAYIHHLAVHPDYQKQEVGKTLVKFVNSIYFSMKVPKVHLFVEKSNIGVVKFYEKLGAEVRNDLVMMSFVL